MLFWVFAKSHYTRLAQREVSFSTMQQLVVLFLLVASFAPLLVSLLQFLIRILQLKQVGMTFETKCLTDIVHGRKRFCLSVKSQLLSLALSLASDCWEQWSLLRGADGEAMGHGCEAAHQ